MSAPYPSPAPLQSPMVRVAAELAARGGRRSRLNPLVLMSDPERTPDILVFARSLPRGSALIYRHFGADDRLSEAERLRRITAERGVQFLIGADPDLAEVVQADGVHFRRDPRLAGARRWRSLRPDWIISQAALKTGDYTAPLGALDALLVSSVFPSRSPSAGTPIGLAGLARECARRDVPVFALGGVSSDNAEALIGTGAAGLASIGALASELRRHAMTDPIETKPDTRVNITKEEGGQMIVFTAEVPGESATGELTLRRVADGVWNANHTGVPSEIGGRGVGKALVAAMVEDARAQDYRVVPGCPFVAKLFERRPEWAEEVEG